MCKINGKKLAEIRKENGMTQKQFAEALGVSKSAIQNYERERNEPTPENLKKICMLLKINQGEIEIHEIGYDFLRDEQAEEMLEEYKISKEEGICWFDEEGTEFTLVFTPYSLFIIEEKEKPILHDFSEMDIKQLAKEAITDIESDIDTWSGFEAYCDDAVSISINKELITDLIDLIKKKI